MGVRRVPHMTTDASVSTGPRQLQVLYSSHTACVCLVSGCVRRCLGLLLNPCWVKISLDLPNRIRRSACRRLERREKPSMVVGA